MTEIIRNTTLTEALKRHDQISRILRKQAERSAKIPEIVRELEDAGIKLEKYVEPIGYPRDRNMI